MKIMILIRYILAEELKFKIAVYFGGLCFPVSLSAVAILGKLKLSLCLSATP
jgi:uncharacterized membrane protein